MTSKNKSPLQIMKDAVAIFNERGDLFCLVGGHAASLYRTQERFTRDVDFAFVGNPASKSQQFAEKIIEELGLKPMVGFVPIGVDEQKRGSVCMITSTSAPGEIKGIIDILLPTLPWVDQAVRRAQGNVIDLKFAKVPVITPEDLIVAKCYALRNSPDRFQDLDDIKEILQGVPQLDFDYLRAQLEELKLGLPEVMLKYVPGKALTQK